jgi:hypothetical protein
MRQERLHIDRGQRCRIRRRAVLQPGQRVAPRVKDRPLGLVELAQVVLQATQAQLLTDLRQPRLDLANVVERVRP